MTHPNPAVHPSHIDVLESMGVPFATFDVHARCTYASAAALLVFGVPPRLGSSGGPETTFAPGGAEVWAQLERLVDTAQSSGQSANRGGAVQFLPLTPSCGVCIRRFGADQAGVAALAVLQPLISRSGAGALEPFGLTPREREVARLVADGRATKEIAATLGISFHTARHHTERVFSKLGVRGRVAVARLMWRTAPQDGADDAAWDAAVDRSLRSSA